MTDEQKEFVEILHSFKKLKFGMMMPCDCQINPGDFHLLKTIVRCRENNPDHNVRVSDIVNRMAIPAPAVSRGLKSMEAKAMVKREVDVNDRRNTWVTITEEGEIAYKETAAAMSEFFDEIFARMDPGDIAKMNGYLKKLRKAAEEVVEERNIDGGEK